MSARLDSPVLRTLPQGTVRATRDDLLSCGVRCALLNHVGTILLFLTPPSSTRKGRQSVQQDVARISVFGARFLLPYLLEACTGRRLTNIAKCEEACRFCGLPVGLGQHMGHTFLPRAFFFLETCSSHLAVAIVPSAEELEHLSRNYVVFVRWWWLPKSGHDEHTYSSRWTAGQACRRKTATVF